MASDKRMYFTLDAMRGLAAITVVMFHLQPPINPERWMSHAYLAVDFFFALSGFVLANAYDDRLARGLTTLDFMKVRSIRLYPLLFFGSILGLVMQLAGSTLGVHPVPALHLAVRAVSALSLVPLTWQFDNDLFDLNTPIWSLFFELVANAVFAAAWFFLSRHLVKVTLLVAVALIGATLYFGSASLGAEWPNFIGGFPRVFFSLFVGVLLFRRRLKLRLWQPLAWLLPLAFFALFAIEPSPRMTAAYDLACILIVFPLFISLAACVEPGEALRPVFRFLGVTSYGVYVLHFPLRRAFDRGVPLLFSDMPTWMGPMLGVMFIAALMVSVWVVDRSYDVPARRRLTRISASKQSSVAGVSESREA